MASFLKSFFSYGFKHKRLTEDWSNIKEPVEEGVTFFCKRLGMTKTKEAYDEASVSRAIKRVIYLMKVVNQKSQKIALHVSSENLYMLSAHNTKTACEKIPIQDISFCCTDANYDQIFAFVAMINGSYHCHVFVCRSSKMAKTITISIAHAFNIAYDRWKARKDNQEDQSLEDFRSSAKSPQSPKPPNRNNVRRNVPEYNCVYIVRETRKTKKGILDDPQEVDNNNKMEIKKCRNHWASFEDSSGIAGDFTSLSVSDTSNSGSPFQSPWTSWQSLNSNQSGNTTDLFTDLTDPNDNPLSPTKSTHSVQYEVTSAFSYTNNNNDGTHNEAFIKSCTSPLSLHDNRTGPRFQWEIFNDL